MQSELTDNDQISPASDRLVGARGANAARRVREYRLAAVSPAVEPAEMAEIGESGQAQAEPIEARGTDAPAAEPETPAETNFSKSESSKSDSSKGAPRPGRRKRALLLGAAAAVLLAAGGWYGYYYATVGRYMVSTDDAYVRANATTLAAKVAGYVSAIEVPDNSLVHAGQVIARIDNGDYKLAAQAAADKVATQKATVGRVGEQITAAQAAVAQARAQLAAARAVETRTASELKRQQALASKQFASRQTLEQAKSSQAQAVASVQSAQAALASAIANIGVLEAQQQEAEHQLKELKTTEAKAERDLSFTVIRSPIDGVIGNRAMQVGDYVQSGTRLAAVVPLHDVYIDANFKETQIANLRPGQPVQVSVDALPDHTITGTVASMSPASGSVFSLLPPDNATGNFTKIVQRLPVRIHLPASVTDKRLLRPGMSVVVSVDTKPNNATNKAALAGNDSWFAKETTDASDAAPLKTARW